MNHFEFIYLHIYVNLDYNGLEVYDGEVSNEGNSYLHYFLFACKEVVVGEIDHVRTSYDG